MLFWTVSFIGICIIVINKIKYSLASTEMLGDMAGAFKVLPTL